jgi:hypothetical protein
VNGFPKALVNEHKIAPYIPVIDKSKREDGIFSRDDFSFDKERDVYICLAGKILATTRKVGNDDLLYVDAVQVGKVLFLDGWMAHVGQDP